jgi:integrase
LKAAQHTFGYLHCQGCDEAGRAAMFTPEFATYPFPRAAALWLHEKGHSNISPAMVRDYAKCIRALTRWFGPMPLAAVTRAHLRAYQRSRQAQIGRKHSPWRPGDRTVGASRVNKECNTLLQILDVAGRRKALERFYQPLPLPESIGVALEPEEEAHLFRLARSRPRWLVAYCCALLTGQLGPGGKELRYLRVRDVTLTAGAESIFITQEVKNRFRRRVLALEGDALWAMRTLMQRYLEMCERQGIVSQPDHYVLYHRAEQEGAAPDPTRPMYGWRRAWENLRAELAKKYPHLVDLRYYDLRHTAATKMLEDPAISERTAEDMLGHKIDSKMKERYSHIRMKPKRAAAVALDGGYAPVPHEVLTVKKPAVTEVATPREAADLLELAAALQKILKRA